MQNNRDVLRMSRSEKPFAVCGPVQAADGAPAFDLKLASTPIAERPNIDSPNIR